MQLARKIFNPAFFDCKLPDINNAGDYHDPTAANTEAEHSNATALEAAQSQTLGIKAPYIASGGTGLKEALDELLTDTAKAGSLGEEVLKPKKKKKASEDIVIKPDPEQAPPVEDDLDDWMN